MTPSPARPDALLRAQARRSQVVPRLRSHLYTAAGTACAVLLGLLAVLLLAPGGVPFIASVGSGPGVGASVPSDATAGSREAADVVDGSGTTVRSLR